MPIWTDNPRILAALENLKQDISVLAESSHSAGNIYETNQKIVNERIRMLVHESYWTGREDGFKLAMQANKERSSNAPFPGRD